MSLDVGVVTIEYIEPPGKSIHDFLFDLLLNPDTGVDDDYDDDDDWGGSWADNGLYEFKRENLRHRAVNWADDRGSSPSESAALLSWIEALPWRDDMVMLHLGR